MPRHERGINLSPGVTEDTLAEDTLIAYPPLGDIGYWRLGKRLGGTFWRVQSGCKAVRGGQGVSQG